MKLSLRCLALLAVLIGLQPLLASARGRSRQCRQTVSQFAGPVLVNPAVGYPLSMGSPLGYPSRSGIGYPSPGAASIGNPSLGAASIGYPPAPTAVYQLEASIREWYLKYLGREPEPAGISSWVDHVYYRGASVAEVQVGIMSSAECFARCGNDPGVYVQFLIQQITGRQCTPPELQTWVLLFQQRYFGDRSQFCRNLVTSLG